MEKLPWMVGITAFPILPHQSKLTIPKHLSIAEVFITNIMVNRMARWMKGQVHWTKKCNISMKYGDESVHGILFHILSTERQQSLRS
jgi:hypothetical protein